MSRPSRQVGPVRAYAVKSQIKRMDKVHANELLNKHSALSFDGPSESHNLIRRLQQPTSTLRKSATTETPVTAAASFPLNTRARVKLGQAKLLASVGSPNTDAVNHHMIGKSSAPGRVDVLEEELQVAVQFAIIRHYLVSSAGKPKGFSSWLAQGGCKKSKDARKRFSSSRKRFGELSEEDTSNDSAEDSDDTDSDEMDGVERRQHELRNMLSDVVPEDKQVAPASVLCLSKEHNEIGIWGVGAADLDLDGEYAVKHRLTGANLTYAIGVWRKCCVTCMWLLRLYLSEETMEQVDHFRDQKAKDNLALCGKALDATPPEVFAMLREWCEGEPAPRTDFPESFALRVKHEVLHRKDGEDVLTYIDTFTASWLRLEDEWEANRLHRLKSPGDLHDIGLFPFDFTDTLVLFMRWVLPREKIRFLGHDFDPRNTLLTDLEGVRSWIIASGEGESAVAVRRPYDTSSKRHLETAKSEKAEIRWRHDWIGHHGVVGEAMMGHDVAHPFRQSMLPHQLSKIRYQQPRGPPAGKGSRGGGKQLCRSWQRRGECRFGDACRWRHADNVPSSAMAVAKAAEPAKPTSQRHAMTCFNWRDHGNCGFGDNCNYAHSGTAAADSRKPRGAGASQDACRDHSVGRCTRGDNCRYSHEAGAIRRHRRARFDRERADREGPRHPKAVRSATASVAMCWHFNSPDGCVRGDACPFAHSKPAAPPRGEVRRVKPLCEQYDRSMKCALGSSCPKAHNKIREYCQKHILRQCERLNGTCTYSHQKAGSEPKGMLAAKPPLWAKPPPSTRTKAPRGDAKADKKRNAAGALKNVKQTVRFTLPKDACRRCGLTSHPGRACPLKGSRASVATAAVAASAIAAPPKQTRKWKGRGRGRGRGRGNQKKKKKKKHNKEGVRVCAVTVQRPLGETTTSKHDSLDLCHRLRGGGGSDVQPQPPDSSEDGTPEERGVDGSNDRRSLDERFGQELRSLGVRIGLARQLHTRAIQRLIRRRVEQQKESLKNQHLSMSKSQCRWWVDTIEVDGAEIDFLHSAASLRGAGKTKIEYDIDGLVNRLGLHASNVVCLLLCGERSPDGDLYRPLLLIDDSGDVTANVTREHLPGTPEGQCVHIYCNDMASPFIDRCAACEEYDRTHELVACPRCLHPPHTGKPWTQRHSTHRVANWKAYDTYGRGATREDSLRMQWLAAPREHRTPHHWLGSGPIPTNTSLLVQSPTTSTDLLFEQQLPYSAPASYVREPRATASAAQSPSVPWTNSSARRGWNGAPGGLGAPHAIPGGWAAPEPAAREQLLDENADPSRKAAWRDMGTLVEWRRGVGLPPLSWRAETPYRHLGLAGRILRDPLSSPNQYAVNSRIASVVGPNPLGDNMQGAPTPTDDDRCMLLWTPLPPPMPVENATSNDRRQDLMLWRSPQELRPALLRAEDHFSGQGTYSERLSSSEAKDFWNRQGGLAGWRPANGMDVGRVRFVTVSLALLHPLNDRPTFKVLLLKSGDVRWSLYHAGNIKGYDKARPEEYTDMTQGCGWTRCSSPGPGMQYGSLSPHRADDGAGGCHMCSAEQLYVYEREGRIVALYHDLHGHANVQRGFLGVQRDKCAHLHCLGRREPARQLCAECYKLDGDGRDYPLGEPVFLECPHCKVGQNGAAEEQRRSLLPPLPPGYFCYRRLNELRAGRVEAPLEQVRATQRENAAIHRYSQARRSRVPPVSGIAASIQQELFARVPLEVGLPLRGASPPWTNARPGQFVSAESDADVMETPTLRARAQASVHAALRPLNGADALEEKRDRVAPAPAKDSHLRHFTGPHDSHLLPHPTHRPSRRRRDITDKAQSIGSRGPVDGGWGNALRQGPREWMPITAHVETSGGPLYVREQNRYVHQEEADTVPLQLRRNAGFHPSREDLRRQGVVKRVHLPIHTSQYGPTGYHGKAKIIQRFGRRILAIANRPCVTLLVMGEDLNGTTIVLGTRCADLRLPGIGDSVPNSRFQYVGKSTLAGQPYPTRDRLPFGDAADAPLDALTPCSFESDDDSHRGTSRQTSVPTRDTVLLPSRFKHGSACDAAQWLLRRCLGGQLRSSYAKPVLVAATLSRHGHGGSSDIPVMVFTYAVVQGAVYFLKDSERATNYQARMRHSFPPMLVRLKARNVRDLLHPGEYGQIAGYFNALDQQTRDAALLARHAHLCLEPERSRMVSAAIDESANQLCARGRIDAARPLDLRPDVDRDVLNPDDQVTGSREENSISTRALLFQLVRPFHSGYRGPHKGDSDKDVPLITSYTHSLAEYRRIATLLDGLPARRRLVFADMAYDLLAFYPMPRQWVALAGHKALTDLIAAERDVYCTNQVPLSVTDQSRLERIIQHTMLNEWYGSMGEHYYAVPYSQKIYEYHGLRADHRARLETSNCLSTYHDDPLSHAYWLHWITYSKLAEKLDNMLPDTCIQNMIFLMQWQHVFTNRYDELLDPYMTLSWPQSQPTICYAPGVMSRLQRSMSLTATVKYVERVEIDRMWFGGSGGRADQAATLSLRERQYASSAASVMFYDPRRLDEDLAGCDSTTRARFTPRLSATYLRAAASVRMRLYTVMYDPTDLFQVFIEVDDLPCLTVWVAADDDAKAIIVMYAEAKWKHLFGHVDWVADAVVNVGCRSPLRIGLTMHDLGLTRGTRFLVSARGRGGSREQLLRRDEASGADPRDKGPSPGFGPQRPPPPAFSSSVRPTPAPVHPTFGAAAARACGENANGPIDGFRRALFDALVDNGEDGYVQWDSDLQRWRLYSLDDGFNDRLDGAISEALRITNELLAAKARTLAVAPATNAPREVVRRRDNEGQPARLVADLSQHDYVAPNALPQILTNSARNAAAPRPASAPVAPAGGDAIQAYAAALRGSRDPRVHRDAFSNIPMRRRACPMPRHVFYAIYGVDNVDLTNRLRGGASRHPNEEANSEPSGLLTLYDAARAALPRTRTGPSVPLNLASRLRGGEVRVDMMQVEQAKPMVAFYKESELSFGFLSNFFVAQCRMNVLVGTQVFTVLSNILCATGVDIAHLQFTSSETVFMLIKAMVFNDWAMVQRYALEPFMTPDMAKRRGRQIRNYDDTVWEGVRLTAMCVALHCKFESTPDLAARLLSTGNAPLYECSKYDKVWGTGVALGAFRANWPHVNITGSNLLGKALGMVRSSLAAKAAAVAAEAAQLRASGYDDATLEAAARVTRARCTLAELTALMQTDAPFVQRIMAAPENHGQSLPVEAKAAAVAPQMCEICEGNEQHVLHSQCMPRQMCMNPGCLAAGPTSGHCATSERRGMPHCHDFCGPTCHRSFNDALVTAAVNRSRISRDTVMAAMLCKSEHCSNIRYPEDKVFDVGTPHERRDAYLDWYTGDKIPDLKGYCCRTCMMNAVAVMAAEPAPPSEPVDAGADLSKALSLVDDIMLRYPKQAASWNPHNNAIAPNRAGTGQFLVYGRFKVLSDDNVCWQRHLVLVDTGSAISMASKTVMYYLDDTPRLSHIRVVGVHAETRSMDSTAHASGPGFVQVFGGPLLAERSWVQLRVVTAHPSHLRGFVMLLSFLDFCRLGWSYDQHRDSMMRAVPAGGVADLPDMDFGFDPEDSDPLNRATLYPQYYPAPSRCPVTVDPSKLATPRRPTSGGCDE